MGNVEVDLRPAEAKVRPKGVLPDNPDQEDGFWWVLGLKEPQLREKYTALLFC